MLAGLSQAVQLSGGSERREGERAAVAAFPRFRAAWRANAVKLQPRLALASTVARLLPHDMFNQRRAALYRAAGVRVGRGAQILGPLTLLGWGNVASLLEIGDEAALETPCTVSLCAPVRIGHRVSLGMDVMILSGTHDIGDSRRRCGGYNFQPVEIGDGTWVGSRVLILPGVTIGAGCVVAAGAVVTRRMPPNSVVAGNPARVISKFEEPMTPANA